MNTTLTTAITAAIRSGISDENSEIGKAYRKLESDIARAFGKESDLFEAILGFKKKDTEARLALIQEEATIISVDDQKEIYTAAENLLRQMGADRLQNIVAGETIQGLIHAGIIGYVEQNFYEKPSEDWENIYLKSLISQCDSLDLTAIDETSPQDGQGGMIHVSDVFTTLYLKGMDRFDDQTVEDAITGRKKTDEMRDPEKKERLPIHATEAVGSLSRLVILGHPGGGKSTLVNHLSTVLARQRLNEKNESLPGWKADERPLSVRIILRRFAAFLPSDLKKGTQGLVWDYLETLLGEWGCREFYPVMKQTLNKEGGVVFFDGLDEVSASDAEKKRPHIIEAIQDFSRPLTNCRIIVTCREYAYQRTGDWRFPESEFPVVELDLFRSDQIKVFTRTWYNLTGKWKGWNEKRCMDEAENLSRAVETLPHLKELGQYPLLLTLMAQVHGRDGTLPRDRADLYSRTVNLLLAHWENHIVRDLNGSCRVEPGIIARLELRADAVRNVLERLALAAHMRQEGEQEKTTGCADIYKEDLREELAGILNRDMNKVEEVIGYIEHRAGLLHERDQRTFVFPHRTFQEYLASPCVMKKGDFEDFLRDRIIADLPWWQEVFLLAAGSMRNTPKIIYQLVDTLLPNEVGPATINSSKVSHAILSARAMSETEFMLNVEAEKKSEPGKYTKIHLRVQNWLLEAMMAGVRLEAKVRCEAGKALNWLGDPRFDPDNWYLPREKDLGFVEIPAGSFLMGSDKTIDKDAYSDELSQHEVSLLVYRISRHPVGFRFSTPGKNPTITPSGSFFPLRFRGQTYLADPSRFIQLPGQPFTILIRIVPGHAHHRMIIVSVICFPFPFRIIPAVVDKGPFLTHSNRMSGNPIYQQ